MISLVFTWLVEKEVSKKEVTLPGEKDGESEGQEGGRRVKNHSALVFPRTL